MKPIFYAALAAMSLSLSACGGGNQEVGPADLSVVTPTGGDMAQSMNNTDGGMTTGCPQPSDTCVQNPTTNDQIINGCVSADVVKIDITPYYPAQGYTNCVLPTP